MGNTEDQASGKDTEKEIGLEKDPRLFGVQWSGSKIKGG